MSSSVGPHVSSSFMWISDIIPKNFSLLNAGLYLSLIVLSHMGHVALYSCSRSVVTTGSPGSGEGDAWVERVGGRPLALSKFSRQLLFLISHTGAMGCRKDFALGSWQVKEFLMLNLIESDIYVLTYSSAE